MARRNFTAARRLITARVGLKLSTGAGGRGRKSRSFFPAEKPAADLETSRASDEYAPIKNAKIRGGRERERWSESRDFLQPADLETSRVSDEYTPIKNAKIRGGRERERWSESRDFLQTAGSSSAVGIVLTRGRDISRRRLRFAVQR